MSLATNGHSMTESAPLLSSGKLSAPTERRHLWAFWTYSFAAEVFAVVSLTLFLPITLEQFARENGMKLPDKIVPCIPRAISHSEYSPILDEENRCVVQIYGRWVDTASFSMFVYSASVALQALVVITMGGIADDITTRKPLLISFAVTGSLATILFFFLDPQSPVWLLIVALAIVANVCFGASFVLLNSYLGVLARGMPECIEKEQLLVESSRTEDNDDPDNETHEKERREYSRLLSETTSYISARGIAAGYGAGVIVVLLSLIPVTILHGSTLALRLAIGASGIWWLAFTIPTSAWLPGSNIESSTQIHSSRLQMCLYGWVSLGHMLRQIKRLKNTFIYLLAWFILSDGFTTITSTAVLFAKTTLKMESSSLIFVGVLTPSGGLLGALMWPKIQNSLMKGPATKQKDGRTYNEIQEDESDTDKSKASNLSVLILLVALASFIPLYGCLGFVPWIKEKAPFGGLTKPSEIYFSSVYFGFLYGGFTSYARTCFAELIPEGHEAKWFGLFSITDKSSSFIGPLVVGVIADVTGSIRLGFIFLTVVILLPIPILYCIDMEKGSLDAQVYAKEEAQEALSL